MLKIPFFISAPHPFQILAHEALYDNIIVTSMSLKFEEYLTRPYHLPHFKVDTVYASVNIYFNKCLIPVSFFAKLGNKF